MGEAFAAYKQDVESRAFPAEEHTVEMPEQEWQLVLKAFSMR
jgi:ketopantoate hydroxymethyltransferase